MKKIVIYYADNISVFKAMAAVADGIAQGKTELISDGAKVKLNRAEKNVKSYRVAKAKESREKVNIVT